MKKSGADPMISSGGELTFDDFKKLARDQSLSSFEKIGFPDSYRAGKEELIFQDILGKLTNLGKDEQVVLDIGPGCSGLASLLIGFSRQRKHRLILADSSEMLEQLADEDFIEKFAGRFPDETETLVKSCAGRVDCILCYSVLHYIYAEGNLFRFLDRSLEMLNHGGQMLIGDIPNYSKRKRFFSSPTGVKFHQEFTGTDGAPDLRLDPVKDNKIDDSVLLSLVMRARNAGFDAYLAAQADDLPMANRREDLLVIRP